MTPIAPRMPENACSVGEIPFRLERNRTVLALVVSEAGTLDILHDTGMTWDGVCLFHKEAQRHFPSKDLDSVQVGGSGSGEPTYALRANSMTLRFGDVALMLSLGALDPGRLSSCDVVW